MGILEQIAASDTIRYTVDGRTYYASGDLDTAIFASGLVATWALIGLAFYAVNAIFLMRLFKKAGIASWKAWVPIYSQVKFLQIGGYSGFTILLALIPIAGPIALYVFMCLSAYNIGLKLKKESVWVVLYIFVPIVWTGVVGLDHSTWSEKTGRKSVAPEQSPA